MSVENKLKIYTTEEIDLFLSGDRREVDRLLLHGINNMASVMIVHIEKEETIFEHIGDSETVKQRTIWIDAQIKKQERYGKMMDKVTESGLVWVFISFLGFLAYASWDTVLDTIKHSIGKK